MTEAQNKSIGDLYQLKSSVKIDKKQYEPKLCYVVDNVICSIALWRDRFSINHETLPLMLIKSDMDLTPETSTPPAASFSRAMSAATPVLWTGCGAIDDHAVLEEQWNVDKCIPGSVFLTSDGQHVWISYADFKFFDKVEI